jgi:hypothetical protein
MQGTTTDKMLVGPSEYVIVWATTTYSSEDIGNFTFPTGEYFVEFRY